MSNVAFAESDIPANSGGLGRPAEPNPFLEVVQGLKIKGEDGAKAVTATVPHKHDSAEVTKMKSQLQAAGAKATPPRTVRVMIEEDGDSSKLTVWAIPRIVQTRKPKDESATDSSPSPASEGAPDPNDADTTSDDVPDKRDEPAEKPAKSKAKAA